MALDLKASITLDGSGITKGVSQIRQSVSNLAAGIGAAFSVGAVLNLAKKTVEFAGHITDLSGRLGVSTDYLQEMQAVMTQNGGSVDDLTSAFERMGAARIKALEGDANAQDSFSKFGISQEQLKTSAPRDIMDAIAARFKEFGRNDVLVSAFRELGGRGAGALIPAFVDGLESGRQKARDAGLVISAEDIKKLDEVGDSFDRLAMKLTAGFAPAILYVEEVVTNALTNIKAFASAFGAWSASFDLMKILKSNFSIEGLKNGGAAGEVARQLGEGSVAAEKEFVGTIDTEIKRQAAEQKLRAEKIAAQNRQQEVPVVIDKTKPEKIELAKIEKRAAFSDSSLAVGNFLGAGRSTLESVAQKSLQVQIKMAADISKMANKKETTIHTP